MALPCATALAMVSSGVGGDEGFAGLPERPWASRLPGTRCKESSQKRRERRSRAEMRTYSRLVVAAQASAGHHTSEGLLVQVLRLFVGSRKQQLSSTPLVVPGASPQARFPARGAPTPPPPPVRKQLQLKSLLAQVPRPQDGPVDLGGGGGSGPGGAPLGCFLSGGGGGGGGCGGCGGGVGGSFPVVAVVLAAGAAAASVDVARSSSVDVARSSSVVVARSSPSAPQQPLVQLQQQSLPVAPFCSSLQFLAPILCSRCNRCTLCWLFGAS